LSKQKWLVFSDNHGPFNDPRLCGPNPIDSSNDMGLVLDIGQELGVTHIFINGDLLDFYFLNQHSPTNCEIQADLCFELDWGKEFFTKLRKKFPKQKIIFQYGNHEDRLNRFIMKYCKPFWNILKLEYELGLERLDIEHYPYNNAYNVPNTDLFIQHSPPSYSQGNAARTSMIKKGSGSFIWGCTHRPDWFPLKTYTGETYEAHCLGWLGSTNLTDDHKNVFAYTKGHESWGNSFAIVDVYGSDYFIHHHLIKNYKCSINGVLYEG